MLLLTRLHCRNDPFSAVFSNVSPIVHVTITFPSPCILSFINVLILRIYLLFKYSDHHLLTVQFFPILWKWAMI